MIFQLPVEYPGIRLELLESKVKQLIFRNTKVLRNASPEIFSLGTLGDEKNQWRKPRKPYDTLGRFLPVVQQLDSLALFRGILFRKMGLFSESHYPLEVQYSH